MKVLFYYWMQYNDSNTRGGGIQVYLKNIINEIKSEEGIQVYTLSSGIAYNLNKKCYIEELERDGDIRRFQVVNSPMLAPSKSSFYDQHIYLSDSILKNVLRDFIRKMGDIDVIHFQSLEGLTFNVLELKNEFPNIKFIMSVHNYQYFCPQVNLWKNDEASCDDYHEGNDCSCCLGSYPGSKNFKKYYILDYYMRVIGLKGYSLFLLNKIKYLYSFIKKGKISRSTNKEFDKVSSASVFKMYREKNIQGINKYIDGILCVSRRVKEIAVNMGLNAEKVYVSYIGSNFAEKQMSQSKYLFDGQVMKIAYMGYMRKDKGFYFFLDVLESMPVNLAKKISLVIAARFDDKEAVEKIKLLTNKFHSVSLYDGYSRDEIQGILQGVHLGVVPVLWEDNLPQVAIEFKAMGIPVLASNKGGASELSSSAYFRFESGNKADFIDKINNLFNEPSVLEEYWKLGKVLVSPKAHLEELLSYYKKI